MLAIDPGTTQSAWCLFDGEKIVDCGIEPNLSVLELCHSVPVQDVAIEMVASYGMPVGREVFETVLWVGRFFQVLSARGLDPKLVYRQQVKLHLCNSARAKDANIRQAILDRFPATGGGKTPQVGTKSQPGPLYGVKADVWAALGVAMWYFSPDNDKIRPK